MANDLTTQQIANGAVKRHGLELGGVDKAKAPVRRDNTLIQAENAAAKPVEPEASKARAKEDVGKTKEMVKETVDYFNKFVTELQVDLRYEVDDKTSEVIIKFFEKGTDKLIRQIPPEAILNLKQRINDLLGIIYDETA